MTDADELGISTSVRQIDPVRVHIETTFFGTAEKPEGLLVNLQHGHIGLAVGCSLDLLRALVQVKVPTPRGEVMALVFVPWESLHPERVFTMVDGRRMALPGLNVNDGDDHR